VTKEGYTYNDENRIIRTETPNGVWEYEYDALGNRTAVIKDGVRTEYLIDPLSSFGLGSVVFELDNVVGEYNANGVLIANYAHGLGLVGKFDSNGAAYFDADAIGSVNGLTDDSGSYTNRYTYDPFGGIINSIEGVNNPFQFVGEFGVMNDSSGLNFMRARQYDPITGRFTATDPLGLDGGDTNLYQYGLNNPASFVDPEGTNAVIIGALITAAAVIIAAIISRPDPEPEPEPPTPPLPPIIIIGDNDTVIINFPRRTDPLVLDLDGDGVELISLEQSKAFFDTNSNGFREYTSWVSADDGLLVLDANNDGQINDISELFGDNSTNGFDDLATLDSNSDNLIDANDSQFNDLRIWIDRNEDGVTDTGELRTLAQWEIESISLDRTDLKPGDSILSIGNFTFNNGSQSKIAATALEVSLVNTIYNQPVELKAETQFLPNFRGFGQLPNLNIAMSLDQDLLAQMRQLVQLDDGDLAQVYGQVEDFLFKWAGVEDIDPNSRSEFFDARKHAFLEKFFQEPLDFEINRLGNTWGLRQSWADISNFSIGLLAAQSFMRDIFSESSYNARTNSLETQASLSDLLEQIQNNLPEADTDVTRYWSYAIGALDAHNDRFNLSQSEYDNSLKTALGSDLSEYLEVLRNPLFGREEDDLLGGMRNRASFLDGNLGDDRLIGSDLDDILSAGSGNDFLNGRAGEDLIIGGEGIDTVRYQTSDAGVAVDLINNTGSGGEAKGDILLSIENILGSNFNDSLTGNEQNNTLIGLNGDDLLQGLAGKDLLTGGSGIDTFSFNALTDSLLKKFDHITDLTIGSDFIDAPTAVTNSEIARLGAVVSLTEVEIQKVLDSESFGANQAATFTLNSQTFLAINRLVGK
jgi:RHS repeat-associated protein